MRRNLKPGSRGVGGYENLTGYIFISPWLLSFFGITLLPLLASFYYAFTNYDLLSVPRFVGFENFDRMFTQDRQYWSSVKATFYFVVAGVPMRLVLALAVAVVLNKRFRGISVYRALFYLPSLIGNSVAVALVWKTLFGDGGAVSAILNIVNIDMQYSIIGDPQTAIWSIILLVVWQFGSSMLIFLAGLKAIPSTYYEAALVDGANAWQKFFRITIPLLSPVIFFNLVMQTINGFRVFTESYIVTEGGPLDTTLFYALYLYRRGFEFFDMGYASAMAWVLLVVIATCTALLFWSSRSWVYYEAKVQ